jgi:glycosyltransferase involved in cell wall biosynthesis
MTLKVLQVVVAAHLPRGGGKISVTGPERRAANLAPRWAMHGVQPVVCYPARGNLNHIFKAAGLQVIDFEIGDKFNLMAAWHLRKLIVAHKIRAVHTQGPASLDLLAALACFFARVPLVVTRPVMLEDQIAYSRARRSIYSAIDRLITLPLAHKIIAVSQKGFSHLRDHCCVDAEKLELIWNGIDLKRMSVKVESPGHSLQPDARPIRLGMIAQLTPPKGWFDFLEVIARLKSRGNSVQGVIVGDGPLRSELMQKAEALGLRDDVVFEGFVEDVRELCRSFDVLLFTTHREGLSVAVIEALATGLPIVATEVGGIREQVFDGANGFIVQVGEFDAMVTACEKLIANPELRVRMGRESRKIAEDRFSEDRMLEQYVECYRRASQGAAA